MKYPVVALRGMVVMPKMMVHFDVSRPKSIEAVQRGLVTDQKIFVTMQKDDAIENPGFDDLNRIGTICTVKQILRMHDSMIRVLVEGESRAELIMLTSETPCLEGEVEETPVEETEMEPQRVEAMKRSLRELISRYAKIDQQQFGDQAARQISSLDDLSEMLQQLSCRFPADPQQRQNILNCDSVFTQFVLLMQLMNDEIEIGKLKLLIEEKVRKNVEKNQRDYMLREQIRVIREELGEGDSESELEEYQTKTDRLNADDEVKDALRREIRRLRMMPAGSQEGTVIRNYIETLLAMPWNTVTRDRKDIHRAEKILNEDHYGLDKIKERILEYLAVRNFSGNDSGTILCLVGPPGTGKTSIAQSLARAMKRKFVRVSLGGVRDEAEIRGHRRTYIGAMPGRIAAGMRQAGTSNPLMLLDEIDKMSADYHGDTASAMLEVLDPEQNCHFVDHYIEVPMDLSRVIFIATANDPAGIPRPLYDRMEIIEVSGYTENEKFHIGHDYLLDKQRKKNGLTKRQLRVTDDALRKIIHNYTREAGVRELERKIGEICRKSAKKLLEDETRRSIVVKEETVRDYLGREKVLYDMAAEHDDIGIVRGLAWTSVGGDTLEIEVNVMPGKGQVHLTGQMGDVMKESAETGLSFIRSIADQYDIAPDYFEKHDIHLHIPEGAVPKDGPSAGITMATAMLSAITQIPVRADLAMTGEITLRGRVLPIGGLKEKLLAAKMAGVKTVLVPEKNRPDIEELAAEIRDGLEIRFVSSMTEVIDQAFVHPAPESAADSAESTAENTVPVLPAGSGEAVPVRMGRQV